MDEANKIPTKKQPSAPGALGLLAAKPSPLLRLPPELRSIIYRMVLVSQTHLRILSAGLSEPRLLTACSRIRKEACSIYSFENQFRIIIPGYDPTVVLQWDQRIEALVQRQDIPNKIRYRGGVIPRIPSWLNLVLWLRAVHEKTITFTLDSPTKRPDATMELTVLDGMFSIAQRMKSLPWDQDVKTLEEQRPILAKVDARWNLDSSEG